MKNKDFLPFKLSVNYSNEVKTEAGKVWDRTIRDYEFVYVPRGSFSFESEEKKWKVPKRHVLLIKPESRHILRDTAFDPDAKHICIHFSIFDNNEFPNSIPTVLDCSNDIEIQYLFRKIYFAFTGASSCRKTLMSLMLNELILRLKEISTNTDRDFEPAEQIMQYLKTNPERPVSRKEIANFAEITPGYVNAVFKKKTGMTPIEYNHILRIHESWHLISDKGLSIKETAYKLGFCDQFHFSKIFKKVMGFTPKKLKK